MSLDSPDHAAEFRRNLSQATQRVEAIIDAAEATAEKIRAEAQSDADSYRESRRREVDAELSERSGRIEELTRPLGDRVERLREEARQLSAELNSTLVRLKALGGVQDTPPAASAAPSFGSSAPNSSAVPEPSSGDSPTQPTTVGEPTAKQASESAGEFADSAFAASDPLGPSIEEQIYGQPIETESATVAEGDEPPAEEPTFSAPVAPPDPGPVPVSYPGTSEAPSEPVDPVERGNAVLAGEAAPADDVASEDVLLRATQLAVSGSSRPDIEAALRSEFEIDDVGSVLDGILGPEDA